MRARLCCLEARPGTGRAPAEGRRPAGLGIGASLLFRKAVGGRRGRDRQWGAGAVAPLLAPVLHLAAALHSRSPGESLRGRGWGAGLAWPGTHRRPARSPHVRLGLTLGGSWLQPLSAPHVGRQGSSCSPGVRPCCPGTVSCPGRCSREVMPGETSPSGPGRPGCARGTSHDTGPCVFRPNSGGV